MKVTFPWKGGGCGHQPGSVGGLGAGAGGASGSLSGSLSGGAGAAWTGSVGAAAWKGLPFTAVPKGFPDTGTPLGWKGFACGGELRSTRWRGYIARPYRAVGECWCRRHNPACRLLSIWEGSGIHSKKLT